MLVILLLFLILISSYSSEFPYNRAPDLRGHPWTSKQFINYIQAGHKISKTSKMGKIKLISWQWHFHQRIRVSHSSLKPSLIINQFFSISSFVFILILDSWYYRYSSEFFNSVSGLLDPVDFSDCFLGFARGIYTAAGIRLSTCSSTCR